MKPDFETAMHVFGYVRRHDFRLLKEAIQNGTVSVFEQALAAPNDLIGSSGWLELLTLAARVNQGEIVRLLANDDRVDVNNSLAYESPPLACAVKTEAHQSVASLLACERVNVNLLYDGGITAFSAACVRSLPIVRMFLACPRVDVNMRKPFLVACQYGCVGVIKELIQDPRVDVNVCNNHNQTGLHLAVLFHYHDTVKVLLNCERVTVGLRDKKGESAFYYALEYPCVCCVKLFLSREAARVRSDRARLNTLCRNGGVDVPDEVQQEELRPWVGQCLVTPELVKNAMKSWQVHKHRLEVVGRLAMECSDILKEFINEYGEKQDFPMIFQASSASID